MNEQNDTLSFTDDDLAHMRQALDQGGAESLTTVGRARVRYANARALATLLKIVVMT